MLWSEEAVAVTSAAEEAALVKAAVTAAQASKQSFLGVTYDRQFPPHYNKFILFAPGGAVAWNYSKVGRRGLLGALAANLPSGGAPRAAWNAVCRACRVAAALLRLHAAVPASPVCLDLPAAHCSSNHG